MLINTLSIYSCPVSLIKELEKCCRNFTWYENIMTRKLVIIFWDKVFPSFSQGGLGIKYFLAFNPASNQKLCWDIVNSKEPWAQIVKSRFIKKGMPITHYISSSIWCSIKKVCQGMIHDSKNHH